MNTHQWNQQVEGTCDAHVRTLATWVHHCTRHGNPSTIQNLAPKQGIVTLAHEAKEAWQICPDCPLKRSSGKGNVGARSEEYQS